MRRIGWLAISMCLWLGPAHVRADVACDSDRFIVLRDQGVDPALFAEVRTDLAAELAHRGIDVCSPSATTREPAALATLSSSEGTVSIELDDRITHKRVGRDVTLDRLPANGRALAIAIAVDELLRASWAELTLRRDDEQDDDESEERSEPPTRSFFKKRRVINARGKVPHVPPQYALGPELGYLHSDHSFNAFSLGARLTVRPWGRGWFTLGLGGLASVPTGGRFGDAFAAGLRATFTAGVCSRNRQRVFACGGARGELDYLTLRGVSPAMAEARVQHAGVIQLSAVGLLGFPLKSGRALYTEFALGGAPLGAEASDGTSVIMGVTGLMIGVNLGLDFEL